MSPGSGRDVKQPPGEEALFVVRCEDAIATALTGRDGLAYASPPQPRDHALSLARVLLD